MARKRKLPTTILGRLSQIVDFETIARTVLGMGASWIHVVPRRGMAYVQSGAGLYAITGNPLYAWLAYQQARKHAQRHDPDHERTGFASILDPRVLDYLDGCAERLLTMGREPPRSKPGTLVAEAMGFKRAGRSGRGSPFTEFANRRQLRTIVQAAEVFVLTGEGHKPDFAIDQVAARYRVHRSTVTRSWRRHRALAARLEEWVGQQIKYGSIKSLARALKNSAIS